MNGYSTLVKVTSTEEEVFDLVHKLTPDPDVLFPVVGETAESYTEKVSCTADMDKRYSRFTDKYPEPINNDPRSQVTAANP